MKILRR